MWTDGNGFLYVGDCRIGDREATEAEVSAWQLLKNPPPTLASELASLAMQYKSDMKSLQLNWLSTPIFSGVTEATKKAAIFADMTERKTQYLSDLNEIKAHYNN